MPKQMTGREKIARNFIRKYGREGFRELLDLLVQHRGGQAAADRFGVGRERIRQWKNTFGVQISYYKVHPDILKLLESPL